MKLWHLAIILWVFSVIVIAYGVQNHDKAAGLLGGFFLACAGGLALAALFEDKE
jgi:hypothetical protein